MSGWWRRRSGIALGLLLGLAALLGACAGAGKEAISPTASPEPGFLTPSPAVDTKALGPADAKVVITEYSDFQ